MARVNLSMEEWNKVVKSLNKLLHLLYDALKERDAYKKQRDELINDMQNVKRKAEAFDEIKEAADFEKLNDCSLYDNESFIDRLHHIFDEMEGYHEG